MTDAIVPGEADGLIRPLSRDTLQDQVHRQLVDLILDGRLAPGETVTIQGLADAFGVSPMPIREALKRLTAANALTILSGRSVGIPPLSATRLTDLRNVRLEVEPLAAGWAVAGATRRDFDLARQHLGAVEAAAAVGNLRDYLRGNRALHFTVYRPSGSPILLRIIEDLWLQISPYFHVATYANANAHHREFVEAFCAGDEPSVRQALRADIESAYRSLMKQLPLAAAAGPPDGQPDPDEGSRPRRPGGPPPGRGGNL